MFKKTKRIVGLVILAAFIFTSAYIAYINLTNTVPTFFGYRFLRISSDSMVPELDVGEIIILKKVQPDALEFGDVISYHAEKGHLKGSVVTHQISKEPYEVDGVYYFTTRGIKPESVDDIEITDDQIIGEVLYKIPILGTVYEFFSRRYGKILFFVLLFIIFLDDFILLINKIRERHNIEDDSDHGNFNDIKQSEFAMNQRINEFEGIITDLDDPDL